MTVIITKGLKGKNNLGARINTKIIYAKLNKIMLFSLISSSIKYLHHLIKLIEKLSYTWRPPNLSELTPIIFNTELTHLGSESSISLTT